MTVLSSVMQCYSLLRSLISHVTKMLNPTDLVLPVVNETLVKRGKMARSLHHHIGLLLVTLEAGHEVEGSRILSVPLVSQVVLVCYKRRAEPTFNILFGISVHFLVARRSFSPGIVLRTSGITLSMTRTSRTHSFAHFSNVLQLEFSYRRNKARSRQDSHLATTDRLDSLASYTRPKKATCPCPSPSSERWSCGEWRCCEVG